MSNSSDMAPLYEAHAILSNLIDETEKEFQFNSTLKSVLSLIEAFESSFSINSHNSLAPIGTNNRRKSVVAGMNPNFLNDMQNPVNLQNKIANLPYTSKIESQISNDNINPSLMRNMHITQTLSTTTSAVGTPTPAMAFKRNRSKSIIYQIPVNRLKYMNKIIPINKITYDGNNSKNQNNGKNDFITPLASIQYIKNQYYTDPISKEKLELFMKENPEINQINRIEFDIFSYCSTSNEYVLSSVIYKIFQKLNFFNTFNIPTDKFINYFHDLEYNYGNNHYHNRMHAADVTQVIYYFISNELPSIDSNESKSYVFSPIELMSLITAAAQHDFNHPGKTNAFMVATQSPLAILYNDRSVLEFHHAAESWNLYLSNEKYSWLENLSDTDFKKFRFLSTEAILSTDLKRHFEIIAQFSSKDVVDWNSEVDRMMISNMLIKMADISGPTKPLNTHTHWTNLICKEFYDQGDEEEKLGLSISTYMDKNNPQLALLQYNFINNLVLPLCHTLSTFGLLPGYSVNKNDETIIKVKVMDYLNDNMNFWKLKLESKKSK
ncbi:putative 3',5'-cyclic phosphodiesterase pde-3 [Intoshia linei]|uniref:Phosphodiesterase n=1 Tax=Intoshia linei TaxID=1819745 RepID=A0A177AYK6_9BILA|nr:putative 3',5'-cyclic phosphodiesterase pde-3 [Intoshia linei]